MGNAVESGWLRIIIVLMALVACTKPNPNRCCSEESDCAAKGIPAGSACDEGFVCRGNLCISHPCEASSDCDLDAPYCIAPPDGRCQQQCTEDNQCPGSAQLADQRFCEAGACVECRDATTDCSMASPVCVGGTCVACSQHDQCAGGICADDGSCATETEIAYVDGTGSATSECTLASPCTTIERALSMLPARPYVLIAPGTYSRSTPLVMEGRRVLVGRGLSVPVLTRSSPGPIINVLGAATITIDGLELAGATGSTTSGDENAGHAIRCFVQGGTPSVTVKNSFIRSNEASGITGRVCIITVVSTVFEKNGSFGVELTDVTASIDRSTFAENGSGASLDGGTYVFTNNIVARNVSDGLAFYAQNTGSRIEFNTIIDNALGSGSFGYGFSCQQPVAGSFPNNIIARNRVQTSPLNCTFPSSVIVDSDISGLRFRQPDAAPFDYHLMSGSIAIDMATLSSLGHDIDGEPRPMGAGRDIGADEAE